MDTVPVGEIPVTLVVTPRVLGCLSVNCWAACVAMKLKDEAPLETWNWGPLYDYADEDFALDFAIRRAVTDLFAKDADGRVTYAESRLRPEIEGEGFAKTISGFDSPEAFTAAARTLMKDPAKSYLITGTCLVPNDLKK